jgi:hypothetical protein
MNKPLAATNEDRYGCDPDILLDAYKYAFSKGFFILGMLSDIQEMVARDYDKDKIRQELNRVKYLLAEKVLAKNEAGRLL